MQALEVGFILANPRRRLLPRETAWRGRLLSFPTQAGGEEQQQFLLLSSGKVVGSRFDLGQGVHVDTRCSGSITAVQRVSGIMDRLQATGPRTEAPSEQAQVDRPFRLEARG